MNDVPGQLHTLLGLVAAGSGGSSTLRSFWPGRGARLEYWVQMVFAAVDGRSMWSARGETPLITASPAVAARTRQKWTDGAVIGPDGARALVKIKAVPASKPVGMRSVAADLAALAAVDWPDTLGLAGRDAGTDEHWWQDRHRITELWAVCIALVHGPPPVEDSQAWVPAQLTAGLPASALVSRNPVGAMQVGQALAQHFFQSRWPRAAPDGQMPHRFTLRCVPEEESS
jgi:hypothetical protein